MSNWPTSTQLHNSIDGEDHTTLSLKIADFIDPARTRTLPSVCERSASLIKFVSSSFAMSTQPVLRVGLIGLSASAVTNWASTAHLPNLQTSAGLSRFRITAVCNSSVSAAEATIQAYKLGLGTKAYGNPDDLAADPDVDFVICNTRVDKHWETVLPSIKTGKDVYIEWPIASSAQHIAELVDAAKSSGARVLVGLQGRWAAPVLKIKEILAGASIGKLLSSEVRAYGGTKDREILPVGLKYFADQSIGGNPITIGFGHGECKTQPPRNNSDADKKCIGASYRLCSICCRGANSQLRKFAFPTSTPRNSDPGSEQQ